MEFLETPAHRFRDLVDFAYDPHFVTVDAGGLRMHYVDEGPRDGEVVLLLHGEPTWSYLYRSMIAPLVAAGYRVVAPDLVGFGRSSKPLHVQDHSYARHVKWMHAFLDAVHIGDLTLFGQDWGSLIGLRLVGEEPERFARVVIGNGYLPVGERPKMDLAQISGAAAFLGWRAFALHSPWFVCSKIVDFGSARSLTAGEKAAYDAPFPSKEYMAGPRAMPALVPTSPSDPAHLDNTRAWAGLARFERPFLTLFSTGDPIMRGLDRRLQRRIPGARDQPHDRVRGGHFLQEDSGPLLAARMIAWMR